MTLLKYEHIYGTGEHAYSIGYELCKHALGANIVVAGICDLVGISDNTKVNEYLHQKIFGSGQYGIWRNSSLGTVTDMKIL